jgi:hypothetical protein
VSASGTPRPGCGTLTVAGQGERHRNKVVRLQKLMVATRDRDLGLAARSFGFDVRGV